ncbi:Glycogen biosynthesis protein GlgD [bioreactor metagenome]|uniref:Glycogen biosynthesis protein GlgD n=1 Tax=bioreactor metagenome TaxID=1076179 RepID=A0A645CZ12_9ZZZZ
MPAIHGIDSKVNNALIANGCVIDGEVQNSIIFRGVRIAKGAIVKNCIIMQDSFISEGVHLDSVITDKLVVIKPGKNLSGDPSYPIYIGKSIVI